MADVENTQQIPTNGGSRPVPDPTVLTDQAIAKAEKAIRDWTRGQIEVLEERLNGIDEATKLRLVGIGDIPSRIDEKVTHLKELHDEKFESVQTQFKERDTRQERESKDNKVAVDAAFAAQKEAAAKQEETFSKGIDKSEAATTETINKQAQLIQTSVGAIGSTLSDLKDRVGELEKGVGERIAAMEARLEKRISEVDGKASGIIQQKVGATDYRSGLFMVFGVILALATFLIGRFG